MIQVWLGQAATVGIAAGSLLLWLRCWQVWNRSRLPILFGMAWFFLFFGMYRAYWAWWHFAGQPPQWAYGWHVVAMLWLVLGGIGLLCFYVERRDG